MHRIILIFVCFFFVAKISYTQTNYLHSFDGVKIAYTDQGEGKLVVLIHGFINSGDSWDRTALKPMLLKKGYRVVVPDLRGTGLSGKPQEEEAYKNDAEVKDLKLLLDALGVKKCMAIGYSRGSIVLSKLITQDKRIKKAVIGGMGLHFTDKDWDRRILFSEAFNGVVTPETQGAVRYAKSIHADLRSLHLQQKYQPHTSIQELSTIKAKVLVLAGDLDTDNGSPKKLQSAIPKSVLKQVKGDHNNTVKTLDFAVEVLQFL